MSDRLPSDELLAAYADGALHGEEAKQVEDYLASNRDAAAELDELHRVLANVRAAEPRPTQEPNWAAMQRNIRLACDESATPSWPGRLRQLLRPRFVVGFAAVAAVGALAFLVVRGDSTPNPSEPSVAAASTDAGATKIERVVDARPTDWRAAELADLSSAELDRVLEGLMPNLLAPSTDPDATGDEPVLGPDLVAEWTGSEVGVGDEDDPLGVGLFSEPDYGGLLETLDDTELDRVDSELAKTSPPKAG